MFVDTRRGTSGVFGFMLGRLWEGTVSLCKKKTCSAFRKFYRWEQLKNHFSSGNFSSVTPLQPPCRGGNLSACRPSPSRSSAARGDALAALPPLLSRTVTGWHAAGSGSRNGSARALRLDLRSVPAAKFLP